MVGEPKDARARSWVAPMVFLCALAVATVLIIMDSLPLPPRPSKEDYQAYERGIREVRRLKTAVEQYLLDTGDLPAKLEDLAPKYLPEVPLDPWRRRYEYQRSGDRAFVCFLGRDGERGPRACSVDRDLVAVIERPRSR